MKKKAHNINKTSHRDVPDNNMPWYKKVPALLVFFSLLGLILLYKAYFLIESPWNYILHAYTIVTSLFLLTRLLFSHFYTDDHSKTYPNDAYPSVSFVIACLHEEDSIYATIDTCLNSVYPGKMDCVAVDDGSTKDKTWEEMERAKQKWGDKLTIIKFPQNRGKREGMAEGVLASTGEIVVFVDSDSFVQPDGVKIIVEHFLADSKVGAVSGNSLVENEEACTLTKMQSARYGISYDIFKASESIFGTVTCCPGCFSAYRREAIIKVLPKWRYQTFLGTRSTFGDDRSLTNFVLRTWKVIYCRSAVASTIVPEQYSKFFKQQLRWKKSWVREGTNAGSFIWKKNIIASMSFYFNLLIPIFGPLVLLRIIMVDVAMHHIWPIYYILGVLAMSALFGIYYYIKQNNKYWYYVLLFALLYTFVLIWQMPYALLKLRDTKWGTR